jgi:phospholipid/cholesterol/gamma-HCH transport system substrate-binding protein
MKRNYLIAIGAMVVISIILVTRALLFLNPTPGDEGQTIRARFRNIDKVSIGTRVTFAGKPVGKVVDITLLPEAFDRRALCDTPIYPYELTLSIDSSVTIYKSDEIVMRTAGLMGEKFVAIIPQPAYDLPELLPVTEDDVLLAAQPGTVEDTFSEISSVAGKAEQILEKVGRVIRRNEEDLAQMVRSITKASNEFSHLFSTLNTTGFGEKLGTLENQLLLCTDRINTLLSDMTTYGWLFHLNRDWQRERHRREEFPSAREASKQGFQQISESLLKVQEALEEADKEYVQENKESFKREFIERVSQLQNEINRLKEAIDRLSNEEER